MEIWKTKIKNFLSVVLVVPVLLFAKAVCAAPIIDVPTGGVLPDLEPEGVFNALISKGLLILGGVATIMIIYGGYLILFGGENKDNYEKGKKVVMYTVIGIIVIALAATVVRFALEVIQ